VTDVVGGERLGIFRSPAPAGLIPHAPAAFLDDDGRIGDEDWLLHAAVEDRAAADPLERIVCVAGLALGNSYCDIEADRHAERPPLVVEALDTFILHDPAAH